MRYGTIRLAFAVAWFALAAAFLAQPWLSGDDRIVPLRWPAILFAVILGFFNLARWWTRR